MVFGIPENGEPDEYELQDIVRGYSDWRITCDEAILGLTPDNITEPFRDLAEKEWLGFCQKFGNQFKEPAETKDFADFALTVLQTWSVEYWFYEKNPNTNCDRRSIAKGCLDLLRLKKDFQQSWRLCQSGKSAMIIASQPPGSEGRPRLLWEAFHWACEAEFLRRIRMATAEKGEKMKPGKNHIPAFAELVTLRYIHCHSSGTSLDGALASVEESPFAKMPIYSAVLNDETIPMLFNTWGQAYRLRCAWAKHKIDKQLGKE